MFTMYPEDHIALRLLKEEVAAYLNKTRSPLEVLDAIRKVSKGKRYLTEELRDLAFEDQYFGEEPAHARLTAREHQVFMLIIQGRTVSEVAAELNLSVSTVSNHVAQVKIKLGVNSLGEIVLYAHRVGLLG